MRERTCILCGDGRLFEIGAAETLLGVTSDCKPWPRSGRWSVCRKCGHIQKVISDGWLRDIHDIYKGYEIYHLSGGAEQDIFFNNSPTPRTMLLVDKLAGAVDIGEKGKLLDVGCGNGSFLRSFGGKYPGWGLFGFEQSEHNRETVSSIPQVESFYSGSLERIAGPFDIIVMTYVIEHLLDPVHALKILKNLLSPDGLLFIHTSDFLENPFDMIITDHCSHFTITTLRQAAELSGIDIIADCSGWIQKEIGFVGKAADKTGRLEQPDLHEFTNRLANDHLSWLGKVKRHAFGIADRCYMGVFGTAIAGTWIANELDGKACFFVDEDPKRQAKTHMGCQVLQPSSIPEGSPVYLAFPYKMAINLFERLTASYPSIRFIKPPAL